MIVTAAPVHGFGQRQTWPLSLPSKSATVMSLIRMLSSNRLCVARARKQLPALCQQRLRRRRRRTRTVRRKGIKGRIKAAPQLLLRLRAKVLSTLSLLLLRCPKVQTRETLTLPISRRGRRLCPRQQRCQPLKRQKFRVCSMPVMRVGPSPAPSSIHRPGSTLGRRTQHHAPIGHCTCGVPFVLHHVLEQQPKLAFATGFQQLGGYLTGCAWETFICPELFLG